MVLFLCNNSTNLSIFWQFIHPLFGPIEMQDLFFQAVLLCVASLRIDWLTGCLLSLLWSSGQITQIGIFPHCASDESQEPSTASKIHSIMCSSCVYSYSQFKVIGRRGTMAYSNVITNHDSCTSSERILHHEHRLLILQLTVCSRCLPTPTPLFSSLFLISYPFFSPPFCYLPAFKILSADTYLILLPPMLA